MKKISYLLTKQMVVLQSLRHCNDKVEYTYLVQVFFTHLNFILKENIQNVFKWSSIIVNNVSKVWKAHGGGGGGRG